MMKKKGIFFLAAVFTVLLVFKIGTSFAETKQKLVTIGTGSISGVYFPTGVAMGELANEGRKQHGFRFAVETTYGSRYNLKAVEGGDLDFGLVQSDVHYRAYKGLDKIEKHQNAKKLRSVFSLVQESLFVVARADAGIKEINDLKGKRVNLGNRGSGQMETVHILMDALGWTEKDFSEIKRLKSNEQAQALCANSVDAVFFTVANYSKALKDITESCDTVFVEVSGGKIDDLVKKNPYYSKTIIPGGVYRGMTADTPTFGVTTTLLTNVDVPEEIVYQKVKAVFDNLDKLKKTHPWFESLKKEEMVKRGLSTPLHPGAVKYYKEVGLM